MRELKFRAWDGKKMLPWNIVRHEHLDGLEDDRWAWMQFTGLKDSEGQDIFEGDVVEIDTELASAFRINATVPITFWRGQFYANENCTTLAGLSTIADIKGETARCTILGNIYEHSHLLEKHNAKP